MENTNDRGSSRDAFLSWLKFALLMLALFLVFRYVIGITVISGNSMNPTIQNKDVIVTTNIFYNPQINDVVQFSDVHGFDVIKRIIAMPNDTVEINAGVIYVNGDQVDNSYAIGIPNDMERIMVTENSYFVVGDNRTPGESLDSRSKDFGLVSKERIKGKVAFSLYPLSFKVTE
ncbi:signal peptidase I [Sporosarcina luteola]|uniref:signal peptidase I n=1 Tax=Sporosarcina luteola TaxID=582850 RepID=UPI00203DE9A1|nr:signal peptidase I [Sporosarcina luteola]MCM3744057.1 signal peptidase I [Sporosarcina luteola]